MIDLGQFMADRSDLVFKLQNLVDETRRLGKLAYQFLFPLIIDCATRFRSCNCQ